ncbi:MAG: hypothetical protein E7214_13160 [Clostridium sp.]|nr:hypothetical protein [Clostridium sp.]
MRIEGNNTNICVNNIRKTEYKQNEKNKVKENLGLESKLSTKNSEIFKNNDENTLKFKTIYNNATLENINKTCDNDDESLTDDELSKMLDKDLYDSCHLSKNGIEYGSKEYEDWKNKWKDNFVVPLDAPVRVRKALTDIIDSTKDELTRSNLACTIYDNLKGVDTSDINSYFNLCDKVVNENNKFIDDMNASGMANNGYIKVAIEGKMKLNECLLKLKSNLEDIFNK